MRTSYYFTLTFGLLLILGSNPAIAQETTSFQDCAAASCLDPHVEDNGSWTGGSVSTSGPSRTKFTEDTGTAGTAQSYQSSATVQVVFNTVEAEIIDIYFVHAGAGSANGTATMFSDPSCTSTIGSTFDSISSAAGNSTVKVTVNQAAVRCIQFVPSTGNVIVDAMTFNSTSLPVELASFDAQVLDGNDVLLSWSTATEQNSAGFEVQHKAGDLFETLAFVDAAGTTSQIQHYSHQLRDLAPGQHQFRLKQIDLDGTFAYSAMIEAQVELPGAYHLSSPYPNPFNPQTSFTLTVAQAQQVLVSVYDLLGRQVAQLHEGALSAEQAHTFRFDALGLSSGLYLIRAQGEHFATVRQVTLLK